MTTTPTINPTMMDDEPKVYTFDRTSPIPVNVQFERYVEELESYAWALPVQSRIDEVERLTEAYFAVMSKHAPRSLIARLTNIILPKEAEGTDIEYQIHNERQQENRGKKFVKIEAAYGRATDGQKYAPPVNPKRRPDWNNYA